MNTPPLLMGFGLLLWGIQTGFLPYAAVMAVLLELSHLVRSRWEFSEKEYHRIFDLCGLMLLGGGAIATTSDEVRVPAIGLAQWLPFIFFPIIAAQAYGNREKLSMRTLSWFLRRRQSGLAGREVNISFLYLSICVMSASTAFPGRGESGFGAPFAARIFYFAVVTIMAWAFFAMRSRRVHPGIWVVLIAMTSVLGYFGARGLNELQRYLENAVTSWIGQFARRESDLRESQTALGRIGRVKLSSKIILRAEPQDGLQPPAYLREVSYDTYRNTVWRANRQESGELTIETNDVWRFHPEIPPKSSVLLSGYLRRGKGLLALPAGTVELRHLTVGNVQTNVMGVTRVEEGTKFIRFFALSSPDASNDSPPEADDLQIPEEDDAVITQVAEELGLTAPGTAFDEKLRILRSFFATHFEYSTYITARHVDPERRRSAVSVFLTEARSGHCEYFATATVLLARKAGIPARYATGFAVHEASGKNMYVIRERDAHAWALVYRPTPNGGGKWEDFDTTPASWIDAERERASFWQPIADMGSRLAHEFSKWRYSETNFQQYAIWLLIPLMIFLAWRIVFKKKRKRVTSGESGAVDWPGLDSELYEMESALAERGLERQPSESLAAWKRRVQAAECVPAETLETAVELHNKYRFDPMGISDAERDLLRKSVRICLKEMRRIETVAK